MMTIRSIRISLLVCILVTAIEGQSTNANTQNQCRNRRTCSDCSQIQGCAWCYHPNFDNRPRCIEANGEKLVSCPKEYIWNPGNEEHIITNRPLTRTGTRHRKRTSSSGSSSSVLVFKSSHNDAAAAEDVDQITPQKISLKLRINQPHRFELSYSQAEDYPIDLYYLMDLSYSMRDDKENLSKLSDSLCDAMRNITSNFRLGFGSFVDKVLMPYVSEFSAYMREPCPGCAQPYGYHNSMPLNMDTKLFSEKVRGASISGNHDNPEGGFDAIMQAIVCRNKIGWRDQARHLLIFSTDAGFHYAGDGKLAGLIEPNDGDCHLDSRGFYAHSTVQDYPSVSQINDQSKKNAINIIFAVTKQQIHIYDKLSQRIEGSASAVLSSDSSNVVELVRKEYDKISSSIEMRDNASGAVKITYHSTCSNGGTSVPTAKCDGLKVGDVINFTAEVVVTSCPSDPKDWHQLIQVYPVGINESLLIDLEMLCSCPCEHPGHPAFEALSPKCHNQGHYKCGICECDAAHFGRSCECSKGKTSGDIEVTSACRADNSSQIDCNGRGKCVCNVCECDKRWDVEQVISGKYCECDNFSCDRRNELLCSGEDHGSCQCGNCVCKAGWSGFACDCQVSNETCIPPNGGVICSGNGDCECGSCNCKVTEDGQYAGKYCEKYPAWARRCSQLKNCVQCQMYHTGPLRNEEDCAANCTTFTTIGVQEVIVEKEKREYACLMYDEDDCKLSFKYADKKEDQIEVHAQKERECPTRVFMLGSVLGVVAAVVLVGIASLLLWKLMTTIYDRREFARFEKERMNARWDTSGNPIFKEATSTFKNPTYTGM